MRRTALKFEQLGTLATVVVAFAALAALVLTGQAGLRQDLRALQTDMLAGQAELRKEMRAGQAELRREMRAGQAELRAGQERLREALDRLGVRLAVVEHRVDVLEVRFAKSQRRPGEQPAVSDSPSDSPGPGP